MEWFENVLTKSKLMLVAGLLSILCFVYLAVIGILSPFIGIISYMVLAALMIALMVICKDGDTPGQKVLSTAVLAMQLDFYLLINVGTFGNSSDSSIAMLETFMAVLLCAVFFFHILLQTDHKGDQKIVYVNGALLVLMLLLLIIEFVLRLVKGAPINDMMNGLGFACTSAFITCLDARVQTYKAKRYAGIKSGRWSEHDHKKYESLFKL